MLSCKEWKFLDIQRKFFLRRNSMIKMTWFRAFYSGWNDQVPVRGDVLGICKTMIVHCPSTAYLPSDSFHIYIHNNYTACEWTALVKNMGIPSASRGYLYSSEKLRSRKRFCFVRGLSNAISHNAKLCKPCSTMPTQRYKCFFLIKFPFCANI